ncbi:hypothetical protein CHLRE_09g386850v5 [Chlamydomonas reinhardtii]|uniref:Uncharacterized protein n=1 Tax=Chlamydomonas reinhardtii TaxID=3055 RepID=A0A2K3DDU0_CHLRE|nr:uncharacterized protein CHLRE_09g386850v5 [Chlamydomonas reinhardtii]PNW78684.1 hypothetical protein CHLRE_09g386850v5 [Chlamydomonas reinhardtii]
MKRVSLVFLGLLLLSACAAGGSGRTLGRRLGNSGPQLEHRRQRSLRWQGDLLGNFDQDPADERPEDEASKAAAAAARPLMTKAKVKELQDHAHFFGAAEALTRWTESTFALSALAHAALTKQPEGVGSACVHDGKRCLLNPGVVSGAGFPAPQLPAEKIIHRFAREASVCRASTDRAACHLDSNCDWDDRTGACFLAHDPHSDFTTVISMCRDMIYTPAAKACWRRRPDAGAWRPCGETGCKLFPKGSEVGPGSATAEDRCLPDAPAKMQQKDLYNMLKRLYGEAYGVDDPPVTLAVTLANGTEVITTAPAAGATGFGAAALQEGHEFAREGFGSCDTAALHHGFATSCRHSEAQEACEKDNRCHWLQQGGVRGHHCVLARTTVVQLLLGNSSFTRAAVQAEAACTAAAGSRDACLAVKLDLRAGGSS